MTFGNTKSPAAFVTTGSDRVPRASLISTTVAPGTTPPCASFTVPDTEPVVICDDAGSAAARTAAKEAAQIPTLQRQPGLLETAEGCWWSHRLDAEGFAVNFLERRVAEPRQLIMTALLHVTNSTSSASWPFHFEQTAFGGRQDVTPIGVGMKKDDRAKPFASCELGRRGLKNRRKTVAHAGRCQATPVRLWVTLTAREAGADASRRLRR